jgi:DNA-directed RNA polymerase subunit RPC12/RpoP
MPHQKEKQTWSPPEGFQRVDSQIQDVVIYAPAPKKSNIEPEISYACPNCGANIAYDVAAGGIACEYCGYVAPVQAKNVGQGAEEFEFTLETISLSNQGWGIQRKVLACDSCGAQLSLPEGQLSTSCPFCASNQVNIRVGLEEFIRPRFLVPFKITSEETRKAVTQWLGKGWFHPDELKGNTILRHALGIYLPFWTFDSRVNAHWRAQVGYEKTERHYNASQKRWETRTRIEWRWENGDVHLNIDDFLVSGSENEHISHHILKGLYPFNLGEMVTYSPDYLAGWQAQAYETTLTDAWETAKEAIREKAKQACRGDIPSSHVRNFSMTADFADESWRYILLPIYLATYKFEAETYQVMINGQSGTVAGQKPVAWWKVWLAIAALLAPGTILGLIGLPLILIAGIGLIPLVLGIILFIIGMIVSIILYNKARQSEAR